MPKTDQSKPQKSIKIRLRRAKYQCCREGGLQLSYWRLDFAGQHQCKLRLCDTADQRLSQWSLTWNLLFYRAPSVDPPTELHQQYWPSLLKRLLSPEDCGSSFRLASHYGAFNFQPRGCIHCCLSAHGSNLPGALLSVGHLTSSWEDLRKVSAKPYRELSTPRPARSTYSAISSSA